MFPQVCIIEPSFFKTTRRGMYCRPLEGRHLVTSLGNCPCMCSHISRLYSLPCISYVPFGDVTIATQGHWSTATGGPVYTTLKSWAYVPLLSPLLSLLLLYQLLPLSAHLPYKLLPLQLPCQLLPFPRQLLLLLLRSCQLLRLACYHVPSPLIVAVLSRLLLLLPLKALLGLSSALSAAPSVSLLCLRCSSGHAHLPRRLPVATPCVKH